MERSKRIQADQMMQIVTTYTSCPLNRRVASYERADCARIGIVEIIIVDEVIATAGPLRQERASSGYLFLYDLLNLSNLLLKLSSRLFNVAFGFEF